MQRLFRSIQSLFLNEALADNSEADQLASVNLDNTQIPAHLEGASRSQFIRQLVEALRYLREQSPETRLAIENFDPTLIPEHLHDQLSHRVLCIPYKNTGEIDAAHPQTIDEETVREKFLEDARYKLDAPKCIELANFTREKTYQLHHRKLMADLKKKLDDLEHANRATIDQRLERFELIATKIKFFDLPEELIDPISSELLTFPVTIKINDPADKGYIIDWASLKDWWQHHPDTYRHPLYDGQVTELAFNDKQFRLIGKFISLLEQIVAVENSIAELNSPEPHHTILERKKILPEQVPERLIKCNLSGEIITHPVILDQQYLVDYHAYMAWANEPTHPERRYKNYFTDQLIETISYDFKRKAELDAYIQNPQASKEELKKQPLKINRDLRKLNSNQTYQGVLSRRTSSQSGMMGLSLLPTFWAKKLGYTERTTADDHSNPSELVDITVATEPHSAWPCSIRPNM